MVVDGPDGNRHRMPLQVGDKQMTDLYVEKHDEWATRHNTAIANPDRGHEQAIVDMCKGIKAYADAYQREWGPVGDDGYCGDYFLDILKGVHGLLSGPTGSRLDMGTLSTFLNATAIEHYGKDLGEL